MAESSITHCPAAALADMAQHLVNLRLALDSRPSETEPEAAAEVSRAVDVIEERLNATLEFAVEMHMACYTQEDIADTCGVNKDTVSEICRKMADLPKSDKSPPWRI